jgi:hypothetical protein
MRRLLTLVALLLPLAGVGLADGEGTTADAEMQLLIGKVLPRAEQHLKRFQGFLPFGGALELDGQFNLYVGSKPKRAEDIDKVALQVASGLRQLAESGEAQTVCLVVLVRTPSPGQSEKSDAIWLRIEHASGASKSIFYPYVLVGEGSVELGTPFSVSEKPDFFVAQ